MRKLLSLAFSCFFLMACGTGLKQVSSGPKIAPNGDTKGCQNTSNDDHYSVDITFPSGVAIPTKIAIDIDGAEKVNECHPVTSAYPPTVKAQRFAENLLSVAADYVGVRTQLPNTIDLKVIDLSSCGTTQRVVGTFSAVVLHWRSESFGAGCAPHQAAYQSVEIPAAPVKTNPLED